jgi:RHS repeat-associated protein
VAADGTANRNKFTGKERDAESGLDYFGVRYYASSMGRFMSPDSSGYSGLTNPQSWNLYAYTLNNPLKFVDPTGHTVENACSNQAACTAAVAGATGNAEAASRVSSVTHTTDHSFLGFHWTTSQTNIEISGDHASFRALGTNASHLADLVESKQNLTVDIRASTYFTNDRQGALGTGILSSQFNFAGGFTQGPGLTGNNDGNVYIKWNPGPDDAEAASERIPGVNRSEAMGHELLGHLWGEVFGGNARGSAANKQGAVNAENAVRATDPTRGQKAAHDHYQ